MTRRILARYRSRCANLVKARSKNPCNNNKRPRLVSEQTVVKNKRGKANIKGKNTHTQPKRKANTVVSYSTDVSARGTSGGLFKARRSLNALPSVRQKNRKFNEAIKVVKKKTYRTAEEHAPRNCERIIRKIASGDMTAMHSVFIFHMHALYFCLQQNCFMRHTCNTVSSLIVLYFVDRLAK